VPAIKEALAKLRDYYENPLKYAHNVTTDRYGNINGRVRELHAFVTDLGYKHLGCGNYSTVIGITERTVIKINNNSMDPSYEAYAEFCMHNPQNPYLPRIYYHTYMGDRRVPVYVMERLQPWEQYELPPEIDCLYSLHRLARAHRRYDPKLGIKHKLEMACPHLYQFVTECPVDPDDLSFNNIMQRANGQIVITDPAS
jgi:hypothetical protein